MTKGKNFSANQKRNKRNKSDFYQTPRLIIQQFLAGTDEVDMGQMRFMEPCAGGGAISELLPADTITFDINDPNNPQDFLKIHPVNYQVDCVLTNPPFSLAYEFIQHAKNFAPKVIMLLPLSYLHGKHRFDTLYQDKQYPLTKVYVLTRYPMLTADKQDEAYSTGMIVYAWFVFEAHPTQVFGISEPVIRWLDNNNHIASKTKQHPKLLQGNENDPKNY